MALEVDITALNKSKRFLLIYPQKIVSSVLFEAGYAFAANKPTVYFIHNRSDLPFLMRQAEGTKYGEQVNIYEFNDLHGLIYKIEKHGERLWRNR